jgi:F0F1-type ATP synthase delta subunit
MANEDPDLEFKVLHGNILTLAKKKVGSRFLQDHLQKAKQPLINKILEEINGHIVELMTDNYGNYFCSKLIECLQAHQRVCFLNQIKGEVFVKISCNSRGTWALQNIMQVINLNEEFDMVKETLMQNNNIVRVAKDTMGKHMIEKLIKLFPEEKRQFIFDEIMANFQELATDQQGLCAMKALIKQSQSNRNHQ